MRSAKENPKVILGSCLTRIESGVLLRSNFRSYLGRRGKISLIRGVARGVEHKENKEHSTLASRQKHEVLKGKIRIFVFARTAPFVSNVSLVMMYLLSKLNNAIVLYKCTGCPKWKGKATSLGTSSLQIVFTLAWQEIDT